VSRILVADDDDGMRRILAHVLARAGHEVAEASSGSAAIEQLHAGTFDVVLTDLKMDRSTGLDVLRTAQALHPRTAVILMSGYGSVKSASDAFKSGAFDFVEKPFTMSDIQSTIAAALDLKRPVRESETRQVDEQPAAAFDHIVGSSESLRSVVAIARKVAPSHATVLILGESGTGKELIASGIHDASLRHASAMVKVNCAALHENLVESELFGHERGAFTGADRQRIGLFERAHRGTLFLDEIGDLASSTQAKILRVLEKGEFERLGGTRTLVVNVRLIAATNQNLQGMVQAGRFREDLFYRLNVVTIEMPPLRERQTDILDLANMFIRRFASQLEKNVTGLTPEAGKRLQRHLWPGNIRELSNTMERAVLLTSEPLITEANLIVNDGWSSPAGTVGSARPSHVKIPAGGVPLADVERDAILEALTMANWVQKDAAQLLSISPRVINYKIQMLKIARPERARDAGSSAAFG
jgi:two-component system response regulator HydG